MIFISVFEFASGKQLVWFFGIAGVVFIAGLLVQIAASNSFYIKLEKSELPEITVRAKLISLTTTAFLRVFKEKFFAEFIDEEGVSHKFNIPKGEYIFMESGEEGELTFEGDKFVSFVVTSEDNEAEKIEGE